MEECCFSFPTRRTSSYTRFLHNVDNELLRKLIKLNLEGNTKVTQAVFPGMLRKKKDAIVNIGYIDQFSRCLYVEYKKSGIDVQFQVPLYVATKRASIKRSSFFVPYAGRYSTAALRWFGCEPRCTPYWPHSLLWDVAQTLPESANDSWRPGSCLGIRKRGQLKDSRKKE